MFHVYVLIVVFVQVYGVNPFRKETQSNLWKKSININLLFYRWKRYACFLFFSLLFLISIFLKKIARIFSCLGKKINKDLRRKKSYEGGMRDFLELKENNNGAFKVFYFPLFVSYFQKRTLFSITFVILFFVQLWKGKLKWHVKWFPLY